MPENAAPLPDFTRWPSFPFEGDMRVKDLAAPVAVEPPRSGEDAADCVACNTPDDAYIWENERWRVRAMDRPTGLPMVLILECRSHLDMGDLPNLLAAELGVMTVRLERAIRSLDGVARVHVNRWGDGSAHLHMWFLARPYGRLQLRGTFLSLWDDILPTIPEDQWRENLALVAAWLAEFGGHANAEPAHIQWQSPSTFSVAPLATGPGTEYASASNAESSETSPAGGGDAAASESAILTDSSPSRDAGAGSTSTDPATDDETPATDYESPATGYETSSADYEPAFGGSNRGEFSDDGSAAGSGSDHGSSPVDEGMRSAGPAEAGPSSEGTKAGPSSEGTKAAPTAEGTKAAPTPEAAEAGTSSMAEEPAGARPPYVGAQASSDPGDGGEHPVGSGVSLADGGKGAWRPSDLGEAERPASPTGVKAAGEEAAGNAAVGEKSKASTVETVGGDAEDRQAPSLDSEPGSGDGRRKDSGPRATVDRSISDPQTGEKASESSSTVEGNDRESFDPVGTAGGQKDASAETAGTARS